MDAEPTIDERGEKTECDVCGYLAGVEKPGCRYGSGDNTRADFICEYCGNEWTQPVQPATGKLPREQEA